MKRRSFLAGLAGGIAGAVAATPLLRALVPERWTVEQIGGFMYSTELEVQIREQLKRDTRDAFDQAMFERLR